MMRNARRSSNTGVEKRPLTTSELSVSGMTCDNCARHVAEALEEVEGVAHVVVDLEQERARVQWDPNAKPDFGALQAAVKNAGYESELPAQTTELAVQGMTCSNCVRRVTETIKSVKGVASAVADLDQGRVIVHWLSSAEPHVDSLIQAVEEAGYKAKPSTGQPIASRSALSPFHGWKLNVVFGSFVTFLLMIGDWIFQLGMSRWFQWLAFALALPVQIFCGARFYRGAWNQLKVGSSNMDTLVALGSTAAFAYSTWGLFAGWKIHLYFMEAAAIITLISIGHWLESIVSAKAAGSLRALVRLAPARARRLTSEGLETEVPAATLQLNDLVLLKPGDRVPTDGEVVEGGSAVDESMLTGESIPVDKTLGSKLYAGTVNQNGRLVFRVTATGQATALAQIIAVVQRAQSSRARIQKLGDRVSSIFVPAVVLVAIGTSLWWGLATEEARAASQSLSRFLWPVTIPETALAASIIHAVGVLIVACPCAMGLATPAAIMAGTNVAARRGILIRDAVALEKTGRLTAVIFDKTGTLTEGKPSVTAIEDLREPSARMASIDEIAGLMAAPSNHPISQAVANSRARNRDRSSTTGHGSKVPQLHSANLEEWQEVRGRGVMATYRGEAAGLSGAILRLGSLSWLREIGVELNAGVQFIDRWSAQGATLLGLTAGHRLIGLLAVRDVIKAHAATVIDQLVRQQISIYMITGDNKLTAAAIAERVGIPPNNVFAEVRPEQKAEMVRQLQERGERVAFVGDGINDAPALEQADLGIAVSRASDVAREAADIILLKSDIDAIPEALGLAQATLRTIKQNLFWAFFYNAAAVPLAALGFLSPVLCAAAMGLSDLIVIGNALRLRSWKRKETKPRNESNPDSTRPRLPDIE